MVSRFRFRPAALLELTPASVQRLHCCTLILKRKYLTFSNPEAPARLPTLSVRLISVTPSWNGIEKMQSFASLGGDNCCRGSESVFTHHSHAHCSQSARLESTARPVRFCRL